MESLKKHLKELEKLNLPKEGYAIFGSGPLAIRNVRESKDLDIVVKEQIWRNLIKQYPVENNKVIRIGALEIFKDWLPWFKDINLLIDDSDLFNETRFVKLKYLLEWKKTFGREKDKKDLPLIEKLIEEENQKA